MLLDLIENQQQNQVSGNHFLHSISTPIIDYPLLRGVGLIAIYGNRLDRLAQP